MKPVVLLVCLLVLPVVTHAQPAPDLPALSQKLLDAVTSGDAGVWQDLLADDGIFTDENGIAHDKAGMVTQLAPLPVGISGEIKLANPKVAMFGDVGIVSFDNLETEVYFGQTLHSHYRTTDTWRQMSGKWQLIGEESEVLPSEPVPLNPATVNVSDVAGTYAITAEKTAVVTVDNGTVMWARGTTTPVALVALGGDVFYLPGSPRGVKIFVRDAAGKVTGIADRRDNNDILWTKKP